MIKKRDQELRNFGLIMIAFIGGVFGLLSPLLHKRPIPLLPWLICVALAIPTLANPRVLGPFHAAWLKLGGVLGYINSRIILGIIYFFVVMPIGLFRRAACKESVSTRFDRAMDSYRTTRENPITPKAMLNPF